LKTFTTPGTYTWKVPTGVTSVTFDVYGARGGGVNEFIGGVLNIVSTGGPGGEAKAKFTVHPGEVFEIVVGGQGGATADLTTAGAAGFNGGGAGNTRGGGGGGGSDVRIGGRGNPCASSNSCGHTDRIIVGGGGGGGRDHAGADGGGGGGVNGCCDTSGLQNIGTQEYAGSCGGASDGPPGGFGFGGDSANAAVGAGGGGWYGGCGSAGAGGGSGYISPLSVSGSYPGDTSIGNGKVTITTTT
jgi:hypothetical protein